MLPLRLVVGKVTKGLSRFQAHSITRKYCVGLSSLGWRGNLLSSPATSRNPAAAAQPFQPSCFIHHSSSNSITANSVAKKEEFTDVQKAFRFELPPILTPQLSKLRFKKFTLPNGLEGVVISDPDTPTTGAALSVEAGSWHDGPYEGCAHFLEHMLFLGTKGFPDESGYERFIYDANGYFNGYTADDHSLYYFAGLNPDHFDGALDRFSRFFYEPIFAESCVDRERNAVDQEYNKNIESDGWRSLHVHKELANPSHPFSQFNTGNLETMKRIDRPYLKEWFKKHYQAHHMKLVIHGKESVEDLLTKVNTFFSPIPSDRTGSDAQKWTLETSPIFPDSLKKAMVLIEPIKDLKQLSLTWEIPYHFANLKSKPAFLVSHLLGFEGKGSILASLKKEGLVEGLSAGKMNPGSENLLFEISVSLTDAGVQARQRVIQIIFEGIDYYRSQPIPEYILDEINLMSKIRYQYQQRTSEMATHYCQILREEGLETFPSLSLFVQEYDPLAVAELLSQLSPKNVMMTLIAPNLLKESKSSREKWMGARYQVLPIDKSSPDFAAGKKSGSIKLLSKNPFIPNDQVSLIDFEAKSSVPVLLLDTPMGRLYHCSNSDFRVPEVSISFNIKTPKIRPGSARSTCLSDLYLKFVHERLSDISCHTQAAGLSYSIHSKNSTGIQLSIEGYSQKGQTLLGTILDAMKEPFAIDSQETEFSTFQKSLSRSYLNASKNSPVEQSMEVLSSLLYQRFCSNAQLAEEIPKLKLSDLQEFSKSLFEYRYIESFVGGNITEKAARDAYSLIESKLPGIACPLDLVQRSKILIMKNERPLLQIAEARVKGNSMIWVTDCGQKTYQSQAAHAVLERLMKEPFYSELRTKQQTGYLVHSGGMALQKQLFIQAIIQSNTHDPRDLLARLELFLENFVVELASSPGIESRFAAVKESIIARLIQPYDTMAGKMRFLNRLAYEEDGDFEYLSSRIAALSQLQLKDVHDFAVQYLTRLNKNRLAILSNGNSPENLEFSYKQSDGNLGENEFALRYFASTRRE